MNKQQLAARIWESANRMRSKIEANEYKDYILGFIFYKFLSDTQTKFFGENSLEWEEMGNNEEIIAWIAENTGYFIPREHLFASWLELGADFGADNVARALSSFNRHIDKGHAKVFEGVFDTLNTGLSKLGDTSAASSRAIRDLVWLIKDIPTAGRQDYDVLGFIYEYLISNFAANAGKKAGEFYTPHEVSLLMSHLVAAHLGERKNIRIYDPTSGSGSLLINIGRCASRGNNSGTISYFAQELKENTYNLTRMNLVMRGIRPADINIRNGDTLEDDWPREGEGWEPLYVDAVVSNPPYSQSWNNENKENDPRFASFGVAPRGKADYAFLLHDLHHLKPDGIMAIVLPHGVLFRGGEEGAIRKNLVERNHIDAIIGLPPNIFFGTGIPTIIMLLRQERDNTDVLIIDASKGFAKLGKNNVLRARDIRKITDIVKNRATIPGFSRKISRDEIRDNDYNLNIPRYVDASADPESMDIWAAMFGGIPESELKRFDGFWQAMPALKSALYEPLNEAYWLNKRDETKDVMENHPDVLAFYENFARKFQGFADYLEGELIDCQAFGDTNIVRNRLDGELFRRFENVPILDPYEAYQFFDDAWLDVAADIEILNTEGRDACRIVDPRMVVKKSGSKEEEVQDGWQGRIFPFELVQGEYLVEDLDNLRKLNDKLDGFSPQYAELLEQIEDAEAPFIKNEAFAPAEVKKALKEQLLEPEVLEILKRADKLLDQEKKLKKSIREMSLSLHIKTKEKIENLTDEEVVRLLRRKWIDPLVSEIMAMPKAEIARLADGLEALGKKYAVTGSALDAEIREAETELSAMLGDLTGNEFDMQAVAELKKMLGGV